LDALEELSKIDYFLSIKNKNSMKSANLSELNSEELMQEEKKQKSSVTACRIIICLLMGIAIYSATHKGSFLIACLPLFFMSIFVKSEKNYKAVQTEIQSRKIK
jgi:Na+/glutamate symporter